MTETNEEGQPVVVDLSDVDADQAFELMPKGKYVVIVDDLEYGLSQSSGNPMWTWIFKIAEGEYEGRKLWYHTVFQSNTLGMVKRALNAVGSDLGGQTFNPDDVANSGDLVGLRCVAKVGFNVYEGSKRNKITALEAEGEGGADAGGDSFLND